MQYHLPRYIESCGRYFGEIMDGRLLAMMINHLLSAKGWRDIVQIIGEEGQDLLSCGTALLNKTLRLL